MRIILMYLILSCPAYAEKAEKPVKKKKQPDNAAIVKQCKDACRTQYGAVSYDKMKSCEEGCE